MGREGFVQVYNINQITIHKFTHTFGVAMVYVAFHGLRETRGVPIAMYIH